LAFTPPKLLFCWGSSQPGLRVSNSSSLVSFVLLTDSDSTRSVSIMIISSGLLVEHNVMYQYHWALSNVRFFGIWNAKDIILPCRIECRNHVHGVHYWTVTVK
jgi:hypothetical protein